MNQEQLLLEIKNWWSVCAKEVLMDIRNSHLRRAKLEDGLL